MLELLSMSHIAETLRILKIDLDTRKGTCRDLKEVTKQTGALEALNKYKHGPWQDRGGFEPDLCLIDENTGALMVETRLVYPNTEAEDSTYVAVGAALNPNGEINVYASSDGEVIFTSHEKDKDLVKEITTIFNADAVRRQAGDILPPDVNWINIKSRKDNPGD